MVIEPLVGIAEMADLLGVSVDTIRRFAKNQAIPHLKLGTNYRFQPSKVIEALEVPMVNKIPIARIRTEDKI